MIIVQWVVFRNGGTGNALPRALGKNQRFTEVVIAGEQASIPRQSMRRPTSPNAPMPVHCKAPQREVSQWGQSPHCPKPCGNLADSDGQSSFASSLKRCSSGALRRFHPLPAEVRRVSRMGRWTMRPEIVTAGKSSAKAGGMEKARSSAGRYFTLIFLSHPPAPGSA